MSVVTATGTTAAVPAPASVAAFTRAEWTAFPASRTTFSSCADTVHATLRTPSRRPRPATIAGTSAASTPVTSR